MGGNSETKSHTGLRAKCFRYHTPQRQKSRLELSGELTEFIGVFRTDSRDDGISESRGPLRFALVNKMCNAGPALALAGGLRGVLREALEEADGGRLEVLHGVCGRGGIGIGWRVGNFYAG